MKTKHITIEREYGSGGTKIARLVSEKAGIPCYGREILTAVSRKYDISVERIEKYEEAATGSFFFSLLALAKSQSGDPTMLTSEGLIFVAEQSEIQQLAAHGSSVFLGHCASEALREQSSVIKVFIRGNKDDKIRRIIEDYKISEDMAEITMKRFNKKRANYYYANTLKRWDDMRNYDMILDSSVIGIEGCANAICGLLR